LCAAQIFQLTHDDKAIECPPKTPYTAINGNANTALSISSSRIN
jgi:hypothetical protein